MLHPNIVREILSDGAQIRLGMVAFTGFDAREQVPTSVEGFNEIGSIKFHARFATEYEKTVFMRFT